MKKTLHTLYPADTGYETDLEGLYLGDKLHTVSDPAEPFVYTNFVSSLDGRIAIANRDRGTHEVPASIANKRDWRLYQELAGRADLVITSGRFFRQTLAGEEQAALPVSPESAYGDIIAWRKQQGMKVQPDIAVLSTSLDIPVDALKQYKDRRLFVITGNRTDSEKVNALRQEGIEVLTAGENHTVEGKALITQLGALGYRSIYAVAGPRVFNTLLTANVLDRLYLTITHQLLSGDAFDTLLSGSPLSPAQGMKLISLYLDNHAPEGASQWFCAFEPREVN